MSFILPCKGRGTAGVAGGGGVSPLEAVDALSAGVATPPPAFGWSPSPLQGRILDA